MQKLISFPVCLIAAIISSMPIVLAQGRDFSNDGPTTSSATSSAKVRVNTTTTPIRPGSISRQSASGQSANTTSSWGGWKTGAPARVTTSRHTAPNSSVKTVVHRNGANVRVTTVRVTRLRAQPQQQPQPQRRAKVETLQYPVLR